MGNFSNIPDENLQDSVKKNYVGVRLQQGVPLLDADWNLLEDLRRYDHELLGKLFVGDGVPVGSDGFRITPNGESDFIIKAGYIIVNGKLVFNPADISYAAQNSTPLDDGKYYLSYTAYLDVWEREVDSDEDGGINDSRLKEETTVRVKREWKVSVALGENPVPQAPVGHTFYLLARAERSGRQFNFIDLRRTGLTVISKEITIKDGKVGIGTTSPTNGILTLQRDSARPELGHISFMTKDADISFDGGNDSPFVINQENNCKLAFVGGNVGVGTSPDSNFKFEVKADKTIKLGLEGMGGGQLQIACNQNDNSIYLEAYNSAGNNHAAEFLLTGMRGQNVPKLSLRADTTSITGNVGIGGNLSVSGALYIANELVPTCKSETLRIIRGTMLENQNQRGYGYWITRGAVDGVFIVHFVDSFTGTPTVVATQHYNGTNNFDNFTSTGGDTRDNCVIIAVSTGGFCVKCGDNLGNGRIRGFEFIAMGPR